MPLVTIGGALALLILAKVLVVRHFQKVVVDNINQISDGANVELKEECGKTTYIVEIAGIKVYFQEVIRGDIGSAQFMYLEYEVFILSVLTGTRIMLFSSFFDENDQLFGNESARFFYEKVETAYKKRQNRLATIEMFERWMKDPKSVDVSQPYKIFDVSLGNSEDWFRLTTPDGVFYVQFEKYFSTPSCADDLEVFISVYDQSVEKCLKFRDDVPLKKVELIAEPKWDEGYLFGNCSGDDEILKNCWAKIYRAI